MTEQIEIKYPKLKINGVVVNGMTWLNKYEIIIWLQDWVDVIDKELDDSGNYSGEDIKNILKAIQQQMRTSSWSSK